MAADNNLKEKLGKRTFNPTTIILSAAAIVSLKTKYPEGFSLGNFGTIQIDVCALIDSIRNATFILSISYNRLLLFHYWKVSEVVQK